MPKIDSLKALLVDQLRDIYDAEKRLTKAIPKLAKASDNDQLKSALEKHLTETEEHVARLERAFDELDEDAKSKTCAAMKGLIEEGDENAKADYGADSLRDAAIIGAAQRVEHYEIAAYGTAIAHARLLELDRVVALLEETLAEEKAANATLNTIAEQRVNPAASNASGAESDRDENEDAADEEEMDEGESKDSGRHPGSGRH